MSNKQRKGARKTSYDFSELAAQEARNRSASASSFTPAVVVEEEDAAAEEESDGDYTGNYDDEDADV